MIILRIYAFLVLMSVCVIMASVWCTVVVPYDVLFRRGIPRIQK